jgi:gluconolactonase
MEGDTSTYLQPSGGSVKPGILGEPGSNGLVLSPEGTLVLLQHGGRRVAQMDAPLSAPEEKYTSLINNYQGKRLNSPNDGAFDANGNLYFTDPPYGLPGGMDDPNKELNFQGVYCLKTSGELVLLDSLTRPNGLALSPDGNHMYVAVSDPSHAVWYQYDVGSPGVVSNKRIFYDLTHLVDQPGQQGLPDGLKVNSNGYIFATGAGGVWIFNPAAKPIARIYTGQKTSNCALGTDEKRLFMTADDYIMAVELK